ncbi:MAG: TOBE-like domain-containing protein, partial [Rhizobium sp.]|nr:TOBE-like domain-containing protein [Rhizobium sp.]
YGKVTACRRLAGTRIAEIDVANDGHEPYHLEIEVPLDAPVAVGADIRFRPTRWKLFGQ